jgi:hypothetical protein
MDIKVLASRQSRELLQSEEDRNVAVFITVDAAQTRD